MAELTPNIQVRLALERTRVAYDRTMMAWIRTATSLITFGFGIYKFFQLELKIADGGRWRIGYYPRHRGSLAQHAGNQETGSHPASISSRYASGSHRWYRALGNVCGDF
jgi:uncharacterized membrane protein YidH (DUF202 family)